MALDRSIGAIGAGGSVCDISDGMRELSLRPLYPQLTALAVAGNVRRMCKFSSVPTVAC